MTHEPYYYDFTTTSSSSSSSRQTVKILTAATFGLSLLLFSGLALTATVIALIIATPLFVLFSPILVPASLALFFLASGLLFAGGCGLAGIAAFSWIYNYVAGKHPMGSDKLDYAGAVIADKARNLKEWAMDYGHYDHRMPQESTTLRSWNLNRIIM